MKFLVLAIALGALPAIALSQSAPAPAAAAAAGQVEHATRGKYRMACAADIARFCADIEKGKGKMRACLESHPSEITAGCKDALAERAAAKSKS